MQDACRGKGFPKILKDNIWIETPISAFSRAKINAIDKHFRDVFHIADVAPAPAPGVLQNVVNNPTSNLSAPGPNDGNSSTGMQSFGVGGLV